MNNKSDNAEIDPGAEIGLDCILTAGVTIKRGVRIGARVVFANEKEQTVVVQSNVTIGAGAVIGGDLVLGRGTIVRPGAVVLSSTPPNAIVEGNPARIVGYTPGLGQRSGADAVRSTSEERTVNSSITELGLGRSAIYNLRTVADLRGSLTVGEFEQEIPFVPLRYFLVFDVSYRALRGEHAHKVCEQFLICVSGRCQILLDNGQSRQEILLDRPNVGVYMPPGIWGTQFHFSKDAKLLVFASHRYDPDDYIRTYEEYLEYLDHQS